MISNFLKSIRANWFLHLPVTKTRTSRRGKLNCPDSVRAGWGLPESLRLHTALSGGHRIDGHLQDMVVVVNVLDRLGKTVDLNHFDIEADLSVVILDPEVESSQARLGRWDFDRSQVGQLIQAEPISGFHIPIEWADTEPTGKEVVVHVRLRAGDDEMRCEGRLNVEKQAAIAEWTPRGDSRR